MERLLFENNEESQGIKMTLTQKYFYRLYELMRKQNGSKIIVTPMDLKDMKIDAEIVKDTKNHWYS